MNDAPQGGDCPHCGRKTGGTVTADGSYIRCAECRRMYLIPWEVRERHHRTAMTRKNKDTRQPALAEPRKQDVAPKLRRRTATLVGFLRVVAGLYLLLAVILFLLALRGVVAFLLAAGTTALFAAVVYHAGQWIEATGEALALSLENSAQASEPRHPAADAEERGAAGAPPPPEP